VKFENIKSPPRVLILGEPASGKTGALAQLANAGYRLFIHDFDQNSRVIGSYLKPGAADIYVNTYTAAKLTAGNLFTGDIANKEAKTKATEEATSAAAIQAVKQLRTFTSMLQQWKEDGADIPASKNLTAKDVIVIDSGTFLGEMLLLAAYEDPRTKRDLRSLYQVAGDYYGAVLDYLCGTNIGASVIVLTHIMQTGEKDDQGRFVGKTRDIPVAIGEKASKRMPTYFSDIWQLEVDRGGNRSFKISATDKIGLRTSNPSKIKAVEPYDLAGLFDRLTGEA
jgi:AAA domain